MKKFEVLEYGADRESFFAIRRGQKYWIVTLSTPFIRTEDRYSLDCDLEELTKQRRAEQDINVKHQYELIQKVKRTI